MKNIRAAHKVIVHNELRALRHRVFITTVAVAKILHMRFNKPRACLTKLCASDQYRLLTLQGWADKYKVSLEFVVTTLVRHWWHHLAWVEYKDALTEEHEQEFYKKQSKKWGIGISVATLVSEKALKVLKKAIIQEFPAGENIDEWRWKKRREFINLGPRGFRKPTTVLDTDNVRDFCKLYGKRIEWRAKQIDMAVTDASRKRRPYRDNPWV